MVDGEWLPPAEKIGESEHSGRAEELAYTQENKEMQRLARRLKDKEDLDLGRQAGSSGSHGAHGYGCEGHGRRRRRSSIGDRPFRGKHGLGNLALYGEKDDPEYMSQEQQQEQEQEQERQEKSTGEGDRDACALKQVFRALRQSVTAPGSALHSNQPHELEGVFRKLTNPATFRRMVMPGLSEEDRLGAPSTFEELLKSPTYASAIENSLPGVIERASSVLEGVKERGRKMGDIMDAGTEEALKPQILQEAFARAVVNVVATVHAKARAKVVMEESQVASHECEEATWDQLRESTVRDLKTGGRRIAVQDDFMGGGEEWTSVLRQDCMRFAQGGKLSVGPGGPEQGEMAWLELSHHLESEVPALHELLLSLHALPFELNRKAPELQLACPLRGSSMLLRLREGCRLPAKVDAISGGVDTGHKVSCVYFVGRARRISAGSAYHGADPGGEMGRGIGRSDAEEGMSGDGEGGQLKVFNIEVEELPGAEKRRSSLETDASIGAKATRGEDAEGVRRADGGVSMDLEGRDDDGCASYLGLRKESMMEHLSFERATVLEPRADRMVLFCSDLTLNETLEVRGDDIYLLLFWMHGTKTKAKKTKAKTKTNEGGHGVEKAGDDTEGRRHDRQLIAPSFSLNSESILSAR